MKSNIVLVFVSCLLFAPNVIGKCLQQASSERLGALRVESCLWREASKGKVVTELRETLTNIGEQDFTLELHRAPVIRFRVFIARGGNTESAVPPAPVLHGPDPLWGLGYESVPLAAGASITLSAPMTDFLDGAPVKKALYTVGVTNAYAWRYASEPEGQAFRLRQLEGNQKRSFTHTNWFEGVRLK